MTMTMPPDELSPEELYLEARKMRDDLSAAVDALNELAAAIVELSVRRGEDSE